MLGGTSSILIRTGTRRFASVGVSSVLALGLLTLFGVENAIAGTISGQVMNGCGSDPDDSGNNVEPCVSQFLAGVSVTLKQGGQVVDSSSSDLQGNFSLYAPGAGSYEVVGGGNCGEQPEVPVNAGSDQSVTLFYPNDSDDSPYGSCTSQSGMSPSIDSESASNITSTDATLEAKINPESMERGADYQFQVVANPSEYLSEFVCPTEGFPANSSLCLGLGRQAGALPIAGTGVGTQDMTVSLDLSAPRGWWSGTTTLKPDTTYHYRVIAARSVQTEDTIQWEPPIVYGPDQTFTTPPAKAPLIESESVSRITPNDATLEARINTEGLETTYEFHMVGAYCEWPCESPEYLFTLPAGKLLGSFIGQNVSLDLNSAGVPPMPVDTYWVTATNAVGTTTGPSHTFRSGEEGVQPLATVAPSGGESQASTSSGTQPADSNGSSGSALVPKTLAKPLTKRKPHHKRNHRHHRSNATRRVHHRLKRSKRP